MTVERGKSSPWYFTASAALQMGLIYEDQDDLSRAESAFRLVLSVETDEYKNSLHQKAKAGLARIKSKSKT